MRFRGPKIRLVAGLLLMSFFLGAGSRRLDAQSPKELRIAAAADLQPVMPALANLYLKKTGIKLVVSFGSSANLEAQIENGAPFDLFLGADFTFPEKVVAANLADTKAPVAYAKGTLVVWALKNSPLQPITVDKLVDPRIQKIAIADELHAPFGRAATAALDHMHLMDRLQGKLVRAENVAQAGQFVVSGNAQVGLISLTLATSPHYKEIGNFGRVPESQYPEIRQNAVVMVKSQHRQEAHAFLSWLLSAPIQSQLPNVGLEPIQ